MRRSLVIAMTCALAGAAVAEPTLLDRAQHAIDEVDPATALELTRQALARGGLTASELHRAHRLAGESAAALGDATAARAHFLRWIVLDPEAALPDGVSPKLAERFAEARVEAERLGRLRVEVKVTRKPDRVEVELATTDPLGLIGGMRVRLGDATEVAVTGLAATLPAADAATTAVAVVVTDAEGNELVRSSVAPPARPDVHPRERPRPAAGAAPLRRSKRWPVIVRWTTWTGVAVLAAGAGGYFAVELGKDKDALAALNAASEQHSFDEAKALREQGRTHAWYANVGFGVAGAAALAAVLTFVVEPRGYELVPAPASGGVTVSASFRF